MTVISKTKMNYINTASTQAHGRRFLNAASKVGNYISSLLIVFLLEMLVLSVIGVGSFYLLYLLENLFPFV